MLNVKSITWSSVVCQWAGFRHPGKTCWKTQQKTHTKLNSITACHVSND